MPKVFGPALSLSASKSFGKILTFQKRPSGHAVYPYSKPGGREPYMPSAAQKAQRAGIAGLVSQWKALSQALKNSWDEAAKEVGYIGTGYHFFIHSGGVYPVVYQWSDSRVQWSDSNVGWSGVL